MSNPVTDLLQRTVEDLGTSCPVCATPILGNDLSDLFDPTYEELTKLRSWTFAQLIAWRDLQSRSGLTVREMLAISSHGGDFVGVDGFHGMFVGIEKDGYTHS